MCATDQLWVEGLGDGGRRHEVRIQVKQSLQRVATALIGPHCDGLPDKLAPEVLGHHALHIQRQLHLGKGEQ